MKGSNFDEGFDLLGRKDRVSVTVRINRFLLETIKRNCLSLSDVVNISLAEWLKRRGFLK